MLELLLRQGSRLAGQEKVPRERRKTEPGMVSVSWWVVGRKDESQKILFVKFQGKGTCKSAKVTLVLPSAKCKEYVL